MPFSSRAGTGRTGFIPVPPNNYPFYNEDEKYVPVMQADGGQLSEWKPMYHPTAEQAEADRRHAYETGVPHGYVAPGDKYKDMPTVKLTVVSELHKDEEYGSVVAADGRHSGGPFTIDVSPKMRIEELRRVIYVSSPSLYMCLHDLELTLANRGLGATCYGFDRAPLLLWWCRNKEGSFPRCNDSLTREKIWKTRNVLWSTMVWLIGTKSFLIGL
jgi:hypothetical protein